MIIQPKTRGFICTTAHPVGCAQHVQEQIDCVKQTGMMKNGPKKVLVIGSSTGYGLSSRIVTAFGSQAATVGVFFEREGNERKTASAGWYNSVAFEQKAHEAGLYARSFNGDAFSDEMKQEVVAAVKKDLGGVDLVIYSLASPRRKDPKTGEISRSTLKPIGQSFTSLTLDLNTNKLDTITIEAATEDDIHQTISVMGGEDWELWMNALDEGGVLAEGVMTVAYTYVGPKVTRAVYRNGTIGKAKAHLEATAKKLDERLKKMNGRAFVSANKALVTQSSSAIPVIPLYFVLLSKIMKEKGIEEDCIAQVCRLFTTRFYPEGDIVVDENGFLRVDELELRADVQQAVEDTWAKLTNETLPGLADLEGYKKAFLKLFGFGLEGVDYDQDVDPAVKLLSVPS